MVIALLLVPLSVQAATVRCDLEVSDDRIDRGEEVELTWETSNATEVRIEDDHGNVLVDTDDFLNRDKKDWYDGEIALKPTRDTTYTLIAERGSSDRECEVEVEVEREGNDVVVVSEYREQFPVPTPVVAGVHMAQVPYTGVDVDVYFGKLFAVVATAWVLLAGYQSRRRRMLAK